ncbi:MAG: hypothetical protein ABIJ34_03075 [archaeon]
MEEEKRKKRNFWIVLLLLFPVLLGLYPLISTAGFYFDVTRKELVQEPFQVIKHVNVSVPFETQSCEQKSYRYVTSQGNVEIIGLNVRPNLILHNLEEKWGYYKIKFYFVSQKDFPYEIYGSEHLQEKFDSGDIKLSDAKFESAWDEFYIGPTEAVLINNLTYNSGGEFDYWAIADIIEPSYPVCRTVIEYSVNSEYRTFIEYKMVMQEKTVKEYTTLKDHYKLSGFGAWFVIVFMFMLIIILLVLIFDRYLRQVLYRR